MKDRKIILIGMVLIYFGGVLLTIRISDTILLNALFGLISMIMVMGGVIVIDYIFNKYEL